MSKKKLKGVFLDRDTYGKDLCLSPLEKLPINWSFFPLTSVKEVESRVLDADIIVTNKVVLKKELLEKISPQLICIAATGIDAVDCTAAKKKGISVCNIPSYSTASVAQLTITLLLALASNLLPYTEATKKGLWQKQPIFTMLDYPLIELEGKNLGLIGYGAIGKQVAKIASSLGMHISTLQRAHSSLPHPLSLSDLLRSSDFISIHTPLNEETKNLITKKELSQMKPTAFLLNVSRGGIINEQDLAEALKNKTIAGAALDVLSQEPPDQNHPLVKEKIPNLILTPHIGWATKKARERALEILSKNIVKFLEGNPQNLI